MENREEFLKKIRNAQISEQELEQTIINGLQNITNELETLTDGLCVYLQMVEDHMINSKDDLKLQLVYNRLNRFLGDANCLHSNAQKELIKPAEENQVER